jgi:hypothetical protein
VRILSSWRRFLAAMTVGPALLGACVPDGEQRREDEAVAGRTTFGFEPLSVEGIEPRWGAPVAPGFVAGGVSPSMRVSDELFALSFHEDEGGGAGLRGVPVASALSVPRFCACALFDPGRRELLVIGGRDDRFFDAQSAEIVHVDTGEKTPVDHGGAALFPVGCQAFFSSSSGKGYIFGGLASGTGFTDRTWRYDPETRAITALEVPGPPARYDAGVHELADGSALLVGGMGGGPFGVRFFSDVWRFDADSERWSEVPTISESVPPGRRYPFSAVSPDESLLLYGYGSDSPRGESVLGDLWSFDLDRGAWAPLDVEGALPDARGFAYRWEGPVGSAGVLAFGSDETLRVFEDAWVMRVPERHAGSWK